MSAAPVLSLAAPSLRARLRTSIREFATGAGDTALLWPRWLVLRAVGTVFVIIFAGILREGFALVGPGGLAPIAGFLAQVASALPNGLAAFTHAPSIFWLGSGTAMITAVAWTGLAAAFALTLNLWPRAALLACWACLLSFVATWQVFSGTQVDELMLEVALLCVPFAPSGFRPGLGVDSPPRRIAVFMMRLLLIRVMAESGLIKLIAGDVHWRDLTAMDLLYETAPFPTLLGWLDHQLPHAWHVVEYALTFAAELLAPVLAWIGGRPGRWIAFALWTVLQTGIQLTNNFGWLNVASIALGLLLLDDRMIASALRRLRATSLAARVAAVGPAAAPAPPTWARQGLRIALGAHAIVATFVFVRICRSATSDAPPDLPAPVQLATNLRSANGYTLYARLLPRRFAVEFAGSNDGGETWRAYPFRFQPQRPSDLSPFFAPWYARFEATLQVQANRSEPSPLFDAVAGHLLARTPAILGLFAADPFPDRPPGLMRVRGYHLAFVDRATHRATGTFWRREEAGDYRPLLFVDERAAIAIAASAFDEVRARAIHGHTESRYRLGAAYAYGDGTPKDMTEAARWFRLAADQHHPAAQFFLGLCHAKGDGVPQNHAEAVRLYRLAAEQGNALAQTNLAFACARGEGTSQDETEALVWFTLAAHFGRTEAAKLQAAFAARVGPERTRLARTRSDELIAAIEARVRAEKERVRP